MKVQRYLIYPDNDGYVVEVIVFVSPAVDASVYDPRDSHVLPSDVPSTSMDDVALLVPVLIRNEIVVTPDGNTGVSAECPVAVNLRYVV